MAIGVQGMFNQQYDLTQQLHDSWQVNDLFCCINKDSKSEFDLDLAKNPVLSMETKFYGNKTKSVISFIDNDDIVTKGYLTEGGMIETGFTSQENSSQPSEWNDLFVIDKITSTTANDSGRYKITTIEFSDLLNKKLETAYLPMSFEQVKPSEAYQKLFEGFNLNVDIVPPSEGEEDFWDFITPGNMSLQEWLKKDAKWRGYDLIMDRFNKYLVHESNKTQDKLQHTGETFEYKPKDPCQRNQIIKYDAKGMDLNAIQKATPVQGNKINDEQATKKQMDITIKELFPEGLGKVSNGFTSLYDMVDATSGYKGQMKQFDPSKNPNINQNKEEIFKHLKDLQTMKVWIPGVNRNWIGMKMGMELPMPAHSVITEESEAYSGDWIVKGVRDKIISGGYFIQELEIQRAGDDSSGSAKKPSSMSIGGGVA